MFKQAIPYHNQGLSILSFFLCGQKRTAGQQIGQAALA